MGGPSAPTANRSTFVWSILGGAPVGATTLMPPPAPVATAGTRDGWAGKGLVA
jgi:hypothetical protein